MFCTRPSPVSLCQHPGCLGVGYRMYPPGGHSAFRRWWRERAVLCANHAQRDGVCLSCWQRAKRAADWDGECDGCKGRKKRLLDSMRNMDMTPFVIDQDGFLTDGHRRAEVMRSLTVRPGQSVRFGTVLLVDGGGNATVDETGG